MPSFTAEGPGVEHTAKLAKAIEDSGHLDGVSDAGWDWSDSWAEATTAAPLLATLATYEVTNGAATNNQRESAVYWLLKYDRSDWEGLL